MYDLTVQSAAWPPDLEDRVVGLLQGVGITLRFDGPLLEHDGGWMPTEIVLADDFALSAPIRWCKPGVATGFELSWDEGSLYMTAVFEQTAAAWFVGCAVAVATGGALLDHQLGKRFVESDLLRLLEIVFALRWPVKRPLPSESLRGSLVSWGYDADLDASEEEASGQPAPSLHVLLATIEAHPAGIALPDLVEELFSEDDEDYRKLLSNMLESSLESLCAEGEISVADGLYFRKK